MAIESEVRSRLQSLFRSEFSKLVAVISSQFGLQHIEIAEDIVSETFLTATEHWTKGEIPDNPKGWLYTVAKQKTLYHLRRNKILRDNVLPHYSQDAQANDIEDLDLSSSNIYDSQLKMMFAICHPAIASEAQIGLALRILCGFSIDDIADAFLTNKETINKRLFRARERLRTENITIAFPPDNQVAARLDNVLHILYLLFNEGYYSATRNQSLKKDLCFDAIRQTMLLTENSKTNVAKTHALLALMCFHTSRFSAREQNDSLTLYDDQDRSLWDQELINRGCFHLEQSTDSQHITPYHLEAGIAFWHCQSDETPGKWQNILRHYDLLLAYGFSPVIALNRIYALYKVEGPARALKQAEELPIYADRFYHALMGELLKHTDVEKATIHLEKAREMAKSAQELDIIDQKINILKK